MRKRLKRLIQAENKRHAIRSYLQKRRIMLGYSIRSFHFPSVGRSRGKINVKSQLKVLYGMHRSGWVYALHSIKKLHNRRGVYFDSFIERTFYWNPDGIKPHLEPWVGVIHVPPNIPRWFQYEQSNERIFKTPAWKASLPFCRGLFTLSCYHKKYLERKVEVPVNSLFFATETPKIQWTWERFISNPQKKIVQIGWWLRKLHTIFQLETSKYDKVFLNAEHKLPDGLLLKERKILEKEGTFATSMYQTAKSVPYLNNRDYDKWLSENLVIANLYDTSANNLIAECMVRNTPILINRLPAVEEYLGGDYPLYFASLEEAARKAEDLDLIYEGHRYLTNHPVKEKLSGESFLKSLMESEIYKSL